LSLLSLFPPEEEEDADEGEDPNIVGLAKYFGRNPPARPDSGNGGECGGECAFADALKKGDGAKAELALLVGVPLEKGEAAPLLKGELCEGECEGGGGEAEAVCSLLCRYCAAMRPQRCMRYLWAGMSVCSCEQSE
jgi:hypothetical protein